MLKKVIVLGFSLMILPAMAVEIPIEDLEDDAGSSFNVSSQEAKSASTNEIKTLQDEIASLNKRLERLEQGQAAPQPKTVKEEETNYQKAVNYVKLNKYDDALGELNDYQEAYPNGKYMANVHYWKGMIYSAKGKKIDAERELKIVTMSYQNSPKAPAAWLKLAMIDTSNGDYDSATQKFQMIQKKYPKSDAARLITQHNLLKNN